MNDPLRTSHGLTVTHRRAYRPNSRNRQVLQPTGWAPSTDAQRARAKVLAQRTLKMLAASQSSI